MVSFIPTYMVISSINFFFPITSPLTQNGHYAYKPIHLSTLMCAICAVYPVLLTICCLITNPFGTEENQSSTALRIMYYSTAPMTSLQNLLLRFIAITECSTALEIISFLRLRKNFGGRRGYSKWYLGVLGAFTLFDIMLHIWVMWRDFISSAEPARRVCLVESVSVGMLNFVTAVEWYHKNAAPLLALVFVMAVGLYLVELHEGMCDILRMEFYDSKPEEFEELRKVEEELGLESSYPDSAKRFWFLGSDAEGTIRKRMKGALEPAFVISTQKKMALDFEEFSKEFKILKEMFRKYEMVAGMFSVLLVVGAATSIVEHVGNLTFGLNAKDRSIVLLLETLFYLFVVANFGEFVTSKVEENRDELRDANGHFGDEGETTLEKISDWVIAWDWKLSAKNVFFINHRVVPAIFGTVMTFFIFIFQLRMSETEEQREAAAWRNLTCYYNSSS